jgi:excisionase family DNA binding protein
LALAPAVRLTDDGRVTELLSIPDAATSAGVSVRTMRRWVSSGRVRSVGTGHRRRVVAASLSEAVAAHGQGSQDERSPAATVSATAGAGSAVAAEADRLADLVRELTDRLAEQTALTAIWQERARVLSDQLALTAPQSPTEAPGETETPEPIPHKASPTPLGDPLAPLWRRLWLALATLLALILMIVVVALLVAWPR